MFLAGCLRDYKEEVICDLAQTYGIYDYRSHPAQRVAIFIKGLDIKSRLMRKITKIDYTIEQLLLGTIADNTSFLAWAKTKDAQKNKNRPESILKKITKKDNESNDIVSTATSKEFEMERQRILNKIKKGAKV